MAKLGNLYVSLIADTAAFSSGLGKARSDLNSTSALFNRGLAQIDKGFGGLGRSAKGFASELFSLKGAVGALVGIGAGGGLVAMAKAAVDAVGGLGELASQVGISTDLLQALNYAASQVGLSQEEMQKGVAKLNDTIGAAVAGQKSAIDSFDRLGVKILDVNGAVRPTEAILRDVADAIQGIPDPAVRASAAVDLMGRAGQKLLPFLENGARGIDDLVQKAKDLGLVFDAETIRSADEAADKLATLSMVLKTQFQAALVELAPFLSQFADEMINVARAVNEFFDRIRPDDEKSLQGLEDKFNRLVDLQDKLIAERDALVARKAGRSFMDDIFGTDIDAEIAQKTREIAGLTVDLENLRMRIDAGMLAKSEASTAPAASPPGAGISNPKATGSTSKTQAQKDEEEAAKMIADLQRQLGDIGKTPIDTKVSEALAKIGQASSESKTQVAELIREIQRATLTEDEFARVQAADAEAVAKWTAEMQKGKSVAEGLRTPVEVYRDRVAELNKLHRDGAIDGVTWARGLDQAKVALKDSTDSTEQYRSAIAELGGSFNSAFEEAALGMDQANSAAEALGNALEGLLKDIERIILRIAVTDPIAAGIAGIPWGSLFSGSGLNSAGFRATGAGPGASGNTVASGGGFFDWIGNLLGSIFHEGGVAGQSGGRRRAVPMLAFAGAPRFHSGGGFLGPREHAAILEDGEGVFTAEQMANMAPARSGGNTVVNIIDQRGSGQIEQRETRGANGQKQIDIIVKDAIDRLAGRGSLDKTLGLNYGIKRKPSRSG